MALFYKLKDYKISLNYDASESVLSDLNKGVKDLKISYSLNSVNWNIMSQFGTPIQIGPSVMDDSRFIVFHNRNKTRLNIVYPQLTNNRICSMSL